MLDRLRLVALLSLGLLPCAVLAQVQTFRVEPAKSTVHWDLPDKLHAVNGSFRVQSGSLTFDPAAATMGGKIIVDAGSGKSGNDTRDQKMNDEVLQSSAFRTVTFAPKHYTGTLAATGDSTIMVEGAFTLLGKPHDLVVPMAIHREGRAITAKGTFEVPYVQWGLKDPSKLILRVGKEVKIDLDLVGETD